MPRIVLFPLIAAACLMAQDQTTPPPPAIPDLIKTGQASYMKSDYEAARQSFQQAWEIARMGPMDDPVRYDILKRLVSARAAAGEFADADDFLQLAISWREQNLGMNDPKIVDDVLLSVSFARAVKDFVKALGVMNRVMSMHFRKAAGADSIEVADDFSRIAQIHAEMGKMEDAINWLNSALDLRTKILGPLDPSLVYDLDRLGGLQIASRAYAKAEETYRHALALRQKACRPHRHRRRPGLRLVRAEEVRRRRAPLFAASGLVEGFGVKRNSPHGGHGVRQARDLLRSAEEMGPG